MNLRCKSFIVKRIKDEDVFILRKVILAKERKKIFRRAEHIGIKENDLFFEARAREGSSIYGKYKVLNDIVLGRRDNDDTFLAEEIGYRPPQDMHFDYRGNNYSPNYDHMLLSDTNPNEGLLRGYFEGKINGQIHGIQPFSVTFPKSLGGKTERFLPTSMYMGPYYQTGPWAVMKGILHITELEYLEQLFLSNKISLLMSTASEKQISKIFGLHYFGEPMEIRRSKLRWARKELGNFYKTLSYEMQEINERSLEDYLVRCSEIDEPMIEAFQSYRKGK